MGLPPIGDPFLSIKSPKRIMPRFRKPRLASLNPLVRQGDESGESVWVGDNMS